MATNWNAVLANVNNSADILAILRKVLSLLELKVDGTTIDEVLAQLEKVAADGQITIEEALETLTFLDQKIDERTSAFNEAIEAAAAAGAGANGWTDQLIVTSDGKTQKQWNDEQKQVNTANSSKLSQFVDLLDFIPKSEHQDIINRTSSYDCTPALMNAVATGKSVRISQSGTYKLKTAYIGTSDFVLEATSAGVVLDGNDTSVPYIIENSGSVTKLTATFVAPVKYSIAVELSDVSGLNVGDWLCFYCPTNLSYSSWRLYYRAGEWKQIWDITGNIVTFTQPFYDTYTNLTLDLYKLNSVVCHLKNVKLLRKNGAAGFVKFSLSSDAKDENIELDLKVREGILYDRCIGPVTNQPRGMNLGTGSGLDNDYGIVFANCQHARSLTPNLYARRHAIALGGGDVVCAVPVSDFRNYGGVLSCDPYSNAGAAEMHGNVRDSSYEDCIVNGGAMLGGGDGCYFIRAKIYSNSLGVVAFGREIRGGEMGWIDCEYHSIFADPQASNRGIIDFGGNSNTSIGSQTMLDSTIKISGKVFGGTQFGSATQFAKIRNRGTDKNIDPVLDGIEFNTTTKCSAALSFDVITSGVANSRKIVVDNISGNVPSNLALVPETLPGQSYLMKPMRMQEVIGLTSITTTVSGFSTSPVVTFPFAYPRKPLVQTTPRGVNGAAKTTYGGQRSVTIGVYDQTSNSTFRAGISSTTNLTADDVIEIAYSAKIKEC
ncbi:hypothetical protein [Acinetobacter baumannii]|uniref:phage tailspike polysaccharide lyase family protein n=1 Tax=Acinetobacter baumannii TaxID=470 RepID=UPI003A9700CB